MVYLCRYRTGMVIFMRKMISFVFMVVMMVSIAVTASASVNFTLNTPCDAISDSELYKHVSAQSIWKYSGGKVFYVRHKVSETSEIETNRIAAYRHDTGKTMGANWHSFFSV